MLRSSLGASMLLLLATVFSIGCNEPGRLTRYEDARRFTGGGDPQSGKAAIRRYGCHTCHTIPGVQGANAVVGPPLDRMGKRVYIAGAVLNTPENMIRWIRDPHVIEKGTAMPNTGVSEQDAKNIAAYLYTLE
jgi:cytochrome c1